MLNKPCTLAYFVYKRKIKQEFFSKYIFVISFHFHKFEVLTSKQPDTTLLTVEVKCVGALNV